MILIERGSEISLEARFTSSSSSNYYIDSRLSMLLSLAVKVLSFVNEEIPLIDLMKL